ncbi:MAG: RDD family protein [Candidatus Cloacimonadota bacterium]|nr:RDD family protein [Candidatus Cloacimonadota bacterium]
MSDTPNFEEYSYKDLLEVFQNINEQKYPERKSLVAKLIEEKKDSEEANEYRSKKLEVKVAAPEDKYSTFWPRVFSAILDSIFLWVFFTILSYLIGSLNEMLYFALSYILPFGYYIYFHASYGQTLGKMIMSVKIVRNDNENDITFKHALLRDSVPIAFCVIMLILMFFPVITDGQQNIIISFVLLFVTMFLNFMWFVLELVTMLFNKKRRAVHDFIAGTVVINI